VPFISAYSLYNGAWPSEFYYFSLPCSANHCVAIKIVCGAESRSFRELLTRLIDRYSKLEHYPEEGIAVAIDGIIYRDSGETPIPEGSEVFLIPRIVGG
jgi:sulfur-carrier protein